MVKILEPGWQMSTATLQDHMCAACLGGGIAPDWPGLPAPAQGSFGQSLDGVGAGAVSVIPGTQRHKGGEAVGQLALD